MMHLKHLVTAAAAAASLPSASAIYDPDAEPVEVGSEPAAATFALALPEAAAEPAALAATSEGDASGGAAVATLAAAPPPAGEGVAIATTTTALPPDPLLVGPTWTAVRYRDAGAGGLVGVAGGSVVTFEVEEDGSFDGHAGCNNYFGGFEAGSFGPAAAAASSLRSGAGPASTFVVDGPVGSTRMMCEGVMAQEVAYLANFQGALTFRVQPGGREMTMSDEAGDVVAEYALYTPPILGRTWTAARYYSAEEGALVDVLPGSVVTLEMQVDEKLGGRAGCNGYNAAYDDLTAEAFALPGPVVFTERWCELPAGVMEQESAYLKNFEGGRRRWAILDNGTLELRDADSDAILALYEGADEGAEEAADNGTDEGADAAFAAVSASSGANLPMVSAAVAAAASLLTIHMS